VHDPADHAPVIGALDTTHSVEVVVVDQAFWRGRRVLLTGHTGFKGAWMSLLLSRLGAKVAGIALDPEPEVVFHLAAQSLVRHSYPFPVIAAPLA
jgi:GDP-D-mannose dehydratase